MSGKKKENKDSDGYKLIALNKKAKFEYHFIETYEVGIVLTGNEIKSIRDGQIALKESYVKPDCGELFLIGSHINEYSHSSAKDYNPTRTRKLLMKKHDILKLQSKINEKGLTLVPVKIYLKRGKAKLEIALAKGKDAPDKRKTIKDRELKKQAQRAMKNYN